MPIECECQIYTFFLNINHWYLTLRYGKRKAPRESLIPWERYWNSYVKEFQVSRTLFSTDMYLQFVVGKVWKEFWQILQRGFVNEWKAQEDMEKHGDGMMTWQQSQWYAPLWILQVNSFPQKTTQREQNTPPCLSPKINIFWHFTLEITQISVKHSVLKWLYLLKNFIFAVEKFQKTL